ncbi:RDD family protein [Steroidobacter sp.]|uniref:RDD family protein n=1 Tax=Steroidobacter sp. TaxID=1978227 RepID=UPI001A3922C2|nr:RDD family protein [Steroidobacter sp.]MBL8265546.1 RDD family protein [Steroidobacter sp.]
MNRVLQTLILFATVTCLSGIHPAQAQEPAPPAATAAEREGDLAVERADQQIERAEDEIAAAERLERRIERRLNRHHEQVLIHVGDDSSLPAGDYADSVISILGSASAAGEVGEVVMALGGNATATGPVGEAVVALFGDVFVDNEVGQDVVALFGNVKLGPNAVVDGEVVSMGGTITRDPAATIRGGQQQIAFGQKLGNLDWLKPWFEKCLMYGRPLAFDSGIAWAWWLAFGFLGMYVLLALMFDQGMQRCVDTLEERPVQSVIASVVAVLLSPVLIVVLLITVIGIALVPFLALGLMCAALFGKAVVLATIGRRITRLTGIGAFGHIAVATLLGGLIVMLLYTVPVFGFIVSNLIGALGLGVVVYTLMLAMRSNSAPAAPAAAAAAGNVSLDPEAPAVAPGIVGDGSTVPPPPSSSEFHPTNAELNSLPRAGFWLRMGALILDILLIAIIVNWLEPTEHFFAVVLAGYGALMWKLRGTTIGGIICNLRVVRTDGRDIEWETAVVRALGCFLSIIPAGLGFIWMVFDSNRQTWHDKIAGTVVVRVPRNQPLTR